MKNESNNDRIVRAIVGVILIAIGYSVSGYLSDILYIVGIIALFTAVTGFCLLYKLFGFSTKKLYMKKSLYTGFGIVAVIAVLFFLVTSFGGPSSGGYNTLLGSQEFMTTYKATPGAELIDVRTPAEFSAGHIAGAVDIDFEDPGFETAVKALDPSKTYFVYCRSGNRSGQATAIMQRDGIGHIYQLQGGVSAAPALLQ